MTPREFEEAKAAILGADGEALLRYLRDLYFAAPHRSISPAVVESAAALGWTTSTTPSTRRLTALGEKIADSAREYCNWVDDGRTLPAGLCSERVAGINVLDVGCGFGRHLLALERHGACAVGVDLEEAYLRISRLLAAREAVPATRVLRAAGEKLPFRDASFDIVICMRSLSYMDMIAAIAEMSRVLVDGGRVVLVYGTLSSLTRKLRDGRAGKRGPRHLARTMIELVNSCAYQWCRRRLIVPVTTRTTAAPVRVTQKCLVRYLTRANLTLTSVNADTSQFIASRNPRSAAPPAGDAA